MVSEFKRNASGELRLMVGGEPFTMLAGECHNSSSSSPRVFAEACGRAVSLGMNSVLVPVTWELLEPEEGVFDFSQVDMVLDVARERGLRLGLLWFGAWKNAQCYYAPAWVKRDLGRFPRAQMVAGKNKVRMPDFHNFPYAALSLFGDETRAADARAFASLMAHLREVDGEQGTVVSMQVENEVGEMAAGREHSAAADAAFASEVPADFLEELRGTCGLLADDILAALDAGCGSGTWEEVFGEVAEEVFTTYYMASYVQFIAEAGLAEHKLPLSANCWLDKGHKPGRFPTGGPNARVFGVWRAVAPSIEVLAPDIYVPYFCDVADSYRAGGNPLLVPETATHAYAAPRAIWSVGHHHAVCFAPFGYEEMGEPFDSSAGILFGADTSDPALRTPQDPDEYAAVMRGLAALVEVAGADGRMDAATAERPDDNMIDLGDFKVAVSFAEGDLPGACAFARGADGAVYVLALRCTIDFVSGDEARPNVDILALEDGEMVDGAWVRDQRLNGDEVAMLVFDAPTLLRAELLAYE
ncbi:DUF5597 domain-containing protein [Paratractidigestivibacter sp.]|uniref:DUF5597 domain-containing protein n=1 Tax=Paratractidigestivibacter sp. TaxID=2847316 RepID=UPI002ABE9221|nr:DUF5597 domain-containing protein [Paratractidigestivibacter sp.]